MNLRDLKYLIALADHRHFGNAAKASFVSQPALSMQIKKLEAYLDLQLVERTNKSVLLTANGLLVAERARLILNQVKELKEMAKLAKDPFAGELKIGVIPTLAPYLLPHIMPSLTATFPKLTLYLVEDQTKVILKKLKEGTLDTAILALPVSEPGLHSAPLFDEEFVLGVPNKHVLAKRKVIRQNELAGKDLLLLEEGHCLRDQALEVCHLINAKENSSFRATSLETLRHMVASGIGMTFMPNLACKENDGLTYLAFTQPRPSRTVGMVWRPSTAKEKLLKSMASTINKVMR